MTLNRITIVVPFVLFLNACGGSSSTPLNGNFDSPLLDSSSAPSNPVGEALVPESALPIEQIDERSWTRVDDDFGYDLGIYEKGGVIFTSTHSTRDGVNFESYHTPELNFLAQYRLLSYIDDTDKYYLFAGLSNPGELDTDRWVFYDWATFGDIRFLAGTSDYLISSSFQANAQNLSSSLRDVVEFSTGDARVFRPVVLPNGDNIVTNGTARIAENRNGTILLTDTAIGGWISTDGGRSWESTLEDMGRLDLTVASDDYPDLFYAFSRSAAQISEDGGATWTEISVPEFDADMWVAGTIDSSNGEIVIWGLEGDDNEERVYKSSDNGLTWDQVGPATPGAACVFCALPDLFANEYGYFISADTLFFLSK